MRLLTPVSSLTSLTAATQISSPCIGWTSRLYAHSIDFYYTLMRNISNKSTWSTTPVGNFQIPVPWNSPLFSWTTKT